MLTLQWHSNSSWLCFVCTAFTSLPDTFANVQWPERPWNSFPGFFFTTAVHDSPLVLTGIAATQHQYSRWFRVASLWIFYSWPLKEIAAYLQALNSSWTTKADVWLWKDNDNILLSFGLIYGFHSFSFDISSNILQKYLPPSSEILLIYQMHHFLGEHSSSIPQLWPRHSLLNSCLHQSACNVPWLCLCWFRKNDQLLSFFQIQIHCFLLLLPEIMVWNTIASFQGLKSWAPNRACVQLPFPGIISEAVQPVRCLHGNTTSKLHFCLTVINRISSSNSNLFKRQLEKGSSSLQ